MPASDFASPVPVLPARSEPLSSSEIDRVMAQSRWMARFLRDHEVRRARVAQLAAAPVTRVVLEQVFADEAVQVARSDDQAMGISLRRLRAWIFATLMVRDLTGRATLDEVMSAMSALAEFTIDAALSVIIPALAERHGEPYGHHSGTQQDLMVVGMGKLGGGELNVSSDIDLIFLYGEDGETRPVAGQPLSNHEFFTLAGRRLIAMLAEPTADGFVFRVDMDLRPNGSSGPLVASLDALEEYFMRQGRDWERFAWIKARIVSRPVLAVNAAETQSKALDALRRPFVYRRYLDFGAIEALRNLHGLIRAEVARNQARRSGRERINVKLGRGGIREIEFVVQHFQLIRGGRDPDLRSRSTLTMLDGLARKGMLDAALARDLASAYGLLRRVEHCLQYLDDAQTHVLPADAADRERIAVMAGCVDAEQMLRQLTHAQSLVAGVFDEVFGAREPSATAGSSASEGETPEIVPPRCWGPQLEATSADPVTLDALRQCGYADAEAAWGRLRALWHTSRVKSLAPQSRARLDALIPQALATAVRVAGERQLADATLTLGRLLNLFEAIAGRAAYLALFSEYPHTLERVAHLVAASDWTARYLIRHPILLDELLDSRTLFATPDWPDIARTLRAELAHAEGDIERQMNVLRETHHAHIFRLLAQDIAGRLTVEVLADHLSALADLILEATLEAVWQILPNRHRDKPRFGIIAYGKLGGKELGYASDLDIVFLYDDDDERAAEIYVRYAQRINTWLSSQTTAGALFEIDLALRPDGASGMLVTSLERFRAYQRDSAWAWEHQALTRARFSAGDAELGAAFEAERRAILSRLRDRDSLRREIVAMRKKLHDAHPNPGGQFDLKHDDGGMIDIEFSVQFLVLAWASEYPQLLDDVGNIALLKRAGEAGLIDAQAGVEVGDAYRAYRKSQHALRLADARYARVDAQEFKAERSAVINLWQALFAPSGNA